MSKGQKSVIAWERKCRSRFSRVCLSKVDWFASN